MIGKNLKSVGAKNSHTELKTLIEPNQELQLDFTGPIIDNNNDIYILVSIDRYSRYPHAKAYHNCDTETATKLLKKLHKISRNTTQYKPKHSNQETLRYFVRPTTSN